MLLWTLRSILDGACLWQQALYWEHIYDAIKCCLCSMPTRLTRNTHNISIQEVMSTVAVID